MRAGQDHARRVRSVGPAARAPKREETSSNDCLSGGDALWHAEPKGPWQGRATPGEVTTPASPRPPPRPDAPHAALTGPRTGEHAQPGVAWPRGLLRHCRELPRPADSASSCGAILAPTAVQSESSRASRVAGVPPEHGPISGPATEAATPRSGIAVAGCAVNPSLRSGVREIRSRRAVGAGGGQLPPATRWGRP
jgi:hypothetical protein